MSHTPQLVFDRINHLTLICPIQKPILFQFYPIPYSAGYKVLSLLPSTISWIEYSNCTILNPTFITSCLNSYNHIPIHPHNPNLFQLQNLLQYYYPHLRSLKYLPKSLSYQVQTFLLQPATLTETSVPLIPLGRQSSVLWLCLHQSGCSAYCLCRMGVLSHNLVTGRAKEMWRSRDRKTQSWRQRHRDREGKR